MVDDLVERTVETMVDLKAVGSELVSRLVNLMDDKLVKLREDSPSV